MNLKDKVVVITGASSGIGEELAFQFAAKGSKVVLAARNMTALEKTARAIEAQGGGALAVMTDVTNRGQVTALAEKAYARFGRLDIFVCNAGVSTDSKPFTDCSETELRTIMDTNFMSGAYAVWAAAPLMQQNGGGQIVFVTSVVGRRGIALSGPYCASKFAMQGLAESIRPELIKKNIRVITICPAGVDTPFFVRNGRPTKRSFLLHPVRKICKIIIRASEREKRDVLPTWDAKLLHWGNVFFPGLLDWGISKNKKIK